MTKISQQDIDRARYDIVEVVSSRIDLKKTGKNHSACCPFHKERSPSFTVSEDKSMFYCFGCGAGGDAIEFVMQYDNVTFPAAVEMINGNMAPSITHEAVRKSAQVDRSVKPSDHKEDPVGAQKIIERCTITEQHMHLLRNNTAAHEPQLELNGKLIVELKNLAGEVVNLASISIDGSIQYAAGGISYGAVAILEPAHEHDGSTLLAIDYAEAWRIWWIMKGKSRVICAMSHVNAKWIADKQRVRFTHIACQAEHAYEFEDYGHEVILIPPVYGVKVA